jgi:hypothetical protein
MKTGRMKTIAALLVLYMGAMAAPAVFAAESTMPPPLMIQEQGSFAAGGSVVTGADGKTLHGDHLYAFYQIPVNARKLPLVMWHGHGQFSKTWETTPDGREGYQTLFLRRGFGVYLIDQPRRGNAGTSTVPMTISAKPDEQDWFNTFRVGVWPNHYPGVQFPHDSAALDQYFRQMTPDTGPYDAEVNADAVVALFKKIGPAILVTHSQAGGPGWLAAMKSENVRAIVAYEPGSGFVFPENALPPALKSSGGDVLAPVAVPADAFKRLSKIPIVIYYGDNIPDHPVGNRYQDMWRIRLEMARTWAKAVNAQGGDVTVIHLPDVGLKGNTHFAFSDLNNLQVADLMSRFLHEKGLDGVSTPAK